MVWSMMYTSGPFFFPVKRPRRLIAQIAALVLASSSWVLAQKPGDSTPAANPSANPGTTSLTRPAEGKSKAHADESFQTLVQLNDALEGLAIGRASCRERVLVTV